MYRSDIYIETNWVKLGEDKKLYAAFMDLEKTYDRFDFDALGSVENI